MDGSGNIEIAEMLAFLDVDRTKFSKRLFSIFDDDASGEIDFKEFVLSCWNYCSLCKSSLIVFAFDLCKYGIIIIQCTCWCFTLLCYYQRCGTIL